MNGNNIVDIQEYLHCISQHQGGFFQQRGIAVKPGGNKGKKTYISS
jgi:hypothetical protein